MKSIQTQQLVLDLINSKEDKYKAGRSRIFSRHRAKRRDAGHGEPVKNAGATKSETKWQECALCKYANTHSKSQN